MRLGVRGLVAEVLRNALREKLRHLPELQKAGVRIVWKVLFRTQAQQQEPLVVLLQKCEVAVSDVGHCLLIRGARYVEAVYLTGPGQALRELQSLLGLDFTVEESLH